MFGNFPRVYSITIENNSNVPRKFCVLQEVGVSGHAANADVFPIIFSASRTIRSEPGSKAQFQMMTEYYALFGTTRDDSNGSVHVDVASNVEVKLGPGGTFAALTADNDGNLRFDNAAMQGRWVPTPEAFTISTDNKIKHNQNIHIGIGTKDPMTGEVVPIQTCVAEGGMNQELFPKPKYYIFLSDYRPGTIVDRLSLGSVLTVDFTDASSPDAQFVLNNSGQYTAENDENSNIVWAQGPIRA